MIKKFLKLSFLLSMLGVASDASAAGITEEKSSNPYLSDNPKARLKAIIASPEFSEGRYPNDYFPKIQKDSEVVKGVVEQRFQGDQDRLKNINDAVSYITSLFSTERGFKGTPHSQHVAFTYVVFAAAMSPENNETVFYFDKNNMTSIPDLLRKYYRVMKPHMQTALFQQNIFFFPQLSSNGHVSEGFLNYCMANTVGFCGVPTDILSEYDGFYCASKNFVAHDVSHIQEGMLCYRIKDQVGDRFIETSSERRVLYDAIKKMKKDQHPLYPHVKSIYFQLFHEIRLPLDVIKENKDNILELFLNQMSDEGFIKDQNLAITPTELKAQIKKYL